MNPVSDKLKSKETTSSARKNANEKAEARNKKNSNGSPAVIKDAMEKLDADKIFKRLVKKNKKI